MTARNKITNILGTPVEGPDFYGRENAIKQHLNLLENHDILLLGPRRIGKTSFCRKLMSELKSKGWHVLELNVASCENELEWVKKLHAALTAHKASLWGKAQNKAGEVLESIKKQFKSIRIAFPETGSFELNLNHDLKTDWTSVADSLVELLLHLEHSTLIYLDELPIFLNQIIKRDPEQGLFRVRRFLDWFRNDICSRPGAHSLHWLISGSVGLDTLVQQHNIADSINTLHPSTLHAFSDEEAGGMLLALAQSYDVTLSESEALSIVSAIQWAQPFYLQKFFHLLLELRQSTPDVTVEESVEPIFEAMVTHANYNDYCHWYERLSVQLTPNDARSARLLLQQSSLRPDGARAESLADSIQETMPNASSIEVQELFCGLRDILIRDAYWLADDSSGQRRYRFCLEPLRRWWVRRVSL